MEQMIKELMDMLSKVLEEVRTDDPHLGSFKRDLLYEGELLLKRAAEDFDKSRERYSRLCSLFEDQRKAFLKVSADNNSEGMKWYKKYNEMAEIAVTNLNECGKLMDESDRLRGELKFCDTKIDTLTKDKEALQFTYLSVSKERDELKESKRRQLEAAAERHYEEVNDLSKEITRLRNELEAKANVEKPDFEKMLLEEQKKFKDPCQPAYVYNEDYAGANSKFINWNVVRNLFDRIIPTAAERDRLKEENEGLKASFVSDSEAHSLIQMGYKDQIYQLQNLNRELVEALEHVQWWITTSNEGHNVSIDLGKIVSALKKSL